MEAMTKNMPEFQELTETFTADGLEEEEARDKAYLTILPKLRKDLQSIYLNHLLWIAQMKKDPIHKQIMKTKDAFANDDNFDPEEALEAAVDKRKFLMKRLFGDTRSDFKYLITRATHSPKNRNLFEPYRAKSGLNKPHKNLVT